MSSTSSSSRWPALGLFALLLPAHPASAEPTTLAKGGYVVLTAENLASDLEIGTTVDASADATVRIYGRVPFTGDDEQVRIDGHAGTGKLGLGLDLASERTGGLDTPGGFWSRHWVLSARAELGTERYRFTPLTGDAMTERHQSFSARAMIRRGSYGRTMQWSTQLSASYDRSYAAARATGVVVPGTGGAPDTVRSTVLAPPSVSPALTLRIGGGLYRPALADRLAFGLYLIAATGGDDAAYQPWSQARTVRGELWGYGFLDEAANTRGGLALFLESSRADADGDSETTYGVLVQLRLNTAPLEY